MSSISRSTAKSPLPFKRESSRSRALDTRHISQQAGLHVYRGQCSRLARIGICSPTFVVSMKSSREEAAAVMFTTIDRLLKRLSLAPEAIDILVVNCSLFSPTPSLASMIINHFNMRSDIMVYNLSGMGCSAGLIAVDLARQMLQLTPSARALVFSTENITQNWHLGNSRSMLIANCLFRLGGAAIVLSNKTRDYWRAKYQLKHVVRTHNGATDSAFTCMYQMEDEEHQVGIRLSKELMAIAGEALKVRVPLPLSVSHSSHRPASVSRQISQRWHQW